jgi:hypothetical protein
MQVMFHHEKIRGLVEQRGWAEDEEKVIGGVSGCCMAKVIFVPTP